MATNTYIPTDISGLSWLHPKQTPFEALAQGVQTGSLIARNMMVSQEMAQKKAEFELMYPVELAKQEYALRRQTIETAAATNKMQSDLNVREGMAVVGKVVASVNQYPEKWLDPDFQKDLWSAAAANPDVAKSPIFDNVIANIGLAERMAQQREIAAAASAERIMSDQVAATEKALLEEGKLDLEAVKLSIAAEKAASQPPGDNVSKRTRDNWIAKRALEHIKDGKQPPEAYRLARLEREVAEGNIDPEDLAKRPSTAPAKGVRRYDPATGKFSP